LQLRKSDLANAVERSHLAAGSIGQVEYAFTYRDALLARESGAFAVAVLEANLSVARYRLDDALGTDPANAMIPNVRNIEVTVCVERQGLWKVEA
jgi:hypothetical protein